MDMLTRSPEWIFKPMRYTGYMSQDVEVEKNVNLEIWEIGEGGGVENGCIKALIWPLNFDLFT